MLYLIFVLHFSQLFVRLLYLLTERSLIVSKTNSDVSIRKSENLHGENLIALQGLLADIDTDIAEDASDMVGYDCAEDDGTLLAVKNGIISTGAQSFAVIK